jgi:hypothetical protein
MEDVTFVCHKKKIGCTLVGLMIFFVFGVVAAIANMIANFSFASVVAGLVMIVVCGGLGYFVVLTSIINNPPVIKLTEAGIETVGLGTGVKQSASWMEVESVDVAFHQIQKKNMLTIKLLPPKATIMIAEDMIDDFSNLASLVKAHFLVHQAAIVKSVLESSGDVAKPTAKPAKKSSIEKTGEVVFDREERIEQPELGATFIYKIYNAPNAASAQAFLAKTPVNDAHLYILVNTPEGTTYCRDIQGTYTQ